MTAYFPGGTQQWTLWPFRWWWYFIANWSYWVPQWGTIRVDSSPGALNIELYGMSAGDDVSGPTGDTEFPWGTLRVDSSPGALDIEQYHVCGWQYFRGKLAILNSPGAQWQLTSLGALNIKQWPVHWWYFIFNWWYWFSCGTMRESWYLGALNIEQFYVHWLCYFMAIWWYWVRLGHNDSRLLPRGTLHWTIWCPLVIICRGQLVILSSLGAQ